MLHSQKLLEKAISQLKIDIAAMPEIKELRTIYFKLKTQLSQLKEINLSK